MPKLTAGFGRPEARLMWPLASNCRDFSLDECLEANNSIQSVPPANLPSLQVHAPRAIYPAIDRREAPGHWGTPSFLPFAVGGELAREAGRWHHAGCPQTMAPRDRWLRSEDHSILGASNLNS